MDDKKHIDRLFQEKFKYFEATPSEAVWENIEAELNQEKKKRRVIPIWWRYAAAAAILLLLLTVGNNVFNNTNNPQEIKVVENEDNSNLKNEKPNGINNGSERIMPDKNLIEDNLKKTNNVIVENDDDIIDNSTNDDDIQEKAPYKSNVTVANNSKEPSPIVKIKSPNNNVNNSFINKNDSNSVLSSKENNAITSTMKDESNELIQNKNNELLIDTNSVQNSINNKNNTVAKNEVLLENKNETDVLDNSIKENTLTIEEALDKSNDIAEEENKLNRWRIIPNAAPVYYNGLNEEGSSINSQFNNNPKTGEVNMSYGISTSYAINKKLSIRSGINKMNLGYKTNNVVVFQSLTSSNSSSLLSNLDIDESSPSEVLTSVNTKANISIVSGLDSNNSEFFDTTDSSINQSLGYIEVPLEIQYTLSNKKVGVNVIGGVSSFFLSDNKIFSENENGRELLGKANNINNVSYSANFGLGVNYKISKKVDFNLEPIFKYQINTFNNTSGEFKPYILGVYTGFAIKF